MTSTSRPSGPTTNVDKPPSAKAQVLRPATDGLTLGASPASGRSSETLLNEMRWRTLALELAFVFLAAYVFRLHFPLYPSLGVIAVAAAVNLFLARAQFARSLSPDTNQAAQMAVNIIQFTALMMLSGGSANPFCILLVAPASLAAATLKERRALSICLLAAGAAVVMTLWSLPPPWRVAPAAPPTLLVRALGGVALLLGIGLTAGYAWRVAVDAARMEVALSFTQTVLAREQRLSALGGLAAAAAHELGTPLATISIVAKEMARETAEGPLRDDAELLISQAERCREILRRLTEEPETDDAVHARMTLLQLVNEVIEAHRETTVRVEALVAGPPNVRPPEIRRMPEVLHAMTSLVENAVDFARSEVLVSVRFDEDHISVEVRDDGPGFSPDILTKLGQPYVTSRPGAEGSRSGHIGMGLGFFIAKNLLERTGAAVDFRNGRGGGAIIAARWSRNAIEAPPIPGGFELAAFDVEEFSGDAN